MLFVVNIWLRLFLWKWVVWLIIIFSLYSLYIFCRFLFLGLRLKLFFNINVNVFGIVFIKFEIRFINVFLFILCGLYVIVISKGFLLVFNSLVINCRLFLLDICKLNFFDDFLWYWVKLCCVFLWKEWYLGILWFSDVWVFVR